MNNSVSMIWTELIKPFVRNVVRNIILSIFKWNLFHDIVSNIQWTTLDSKFKISILQTANSSPKVLSYDVIIWEDIRFQENMKPLATTIKPSTAISTLYNNMIHYLLRPIIFVCLYIFFFILSFFVTLRFPPIVLNIILYATTIVQIQLNEVTIKSLVDTSKWFSGNSFAFLIPPEIQTAFHCRSVYLQTSFVNITLQHLHCITLYECLWYHQNMYYNILTSLNPIHGHVYDLIDIQLSLKHFTAIHTSNVFPTALYVFDKKIFAELNRLFGKESLFSMLKKKRNTRKLRRKSSATAEQSTAETSSLIAWIQLFLDQLPDWLTKLHIQIEHIVCSSQLIDIQIDARHGVIDFMPDEGGCNDENTVFAAQKEYSDAIMIRGKLHSLTMTIPNQENTHILSSILPDKVTNMGSITLMHFEEMTLTSLCRLYDRSIYLQGLANKGYLYHPDALQMIHHLIPLQTLTECIAYTTILQYLVSTMLFSCLSAYQVKYLQFHVQQMTYPVICRKNADVEDSMVDDAITEEEDEEAAKQEKQRCNNIITVVQQGTQSLCGFTTASSLVHSFPSSSLALITYEMTE